MLAEQIEIIQNQVSGYKIAQFQKDPGNETEGIICVGEDDRVIMAKVGQIARKFRRERLGS